MKKISRLQVTAWVLSLLPAAMTAVFYSRLPAEIPMQWDLAGHMNYETRWHLWIVAGMAPLFAVLFYFLPRFDPKSRNYRQIFRCLYRVPDHDRPVPDRNVRYLYCGSTASGYGRCADSRMSARQPAGDVPRQHYAEVSHELVLRTQNAVDAVERNCLDENASCGGPHDVCGGYYRCGRLVRSERNCKVCAGACANGGGNDYPDCAELAMVPRRTAVIDEK